MMMALLFSKIIAYTEFWRRLFPTLSNANVGTPVMQEESTLGEADKNFPEPATLLMEHIVGLHNDLFIILIFLTGLLVVVFAKLLVECGEPIEGIDQCNIDGNGWYVVNAPQNANLHSLNRVSQNTQLEVIWTIVPAVILMLMGIPSAIFLLYADGGIYLLDPEIEIVVIGNQWYWVYEY